MQTRCWLGLVLLAALLGCAQRSIAPYVELPGSLAVVNADFEAPANADGSIVGWRTGQHAGESAYTFTVDRSVSATGKASLRVTRTREQIFGVVSQLVPIAAQTGHTIELSAQMRTENVGKKGWQLLLTFTGGVPNPRSVAAPVSGTQPFRAVTIRAVVPPGAQQVEIAATLLDGGTAWIDDVHLRVVD